ncbi:16S rRNA (guanine(527)-N(7))-methyltransferase RsmG [Telmatobacter bradus]|uniref:16S rRNA (guanine(527)-N(7))-methyltransferase RsmG n=1 Tax=Telmatobacter bradus TaxID=474953 RepID=UPI003B4322BC
MEGNSSMEKLQSLLQGAGCAELTTGEAESFEQYLRLFLLWNAKTNLSAVRDEDGILSRHFLESIACARQIPAGVASLLDFGSGGGFPGVPVAICRPEIAVTLAESQGKKAIFLQEVVRTLGLDAKVHARRAEELGKTFDCVTMRAVDRMIGAIALAAALVSAGGILALMSTTAEQNAMQTAAGERFHWQAATPIPGGGAKVLLLGRKEE